jgi:hypothetical protein
MSLYSGAPLGNPTPDPSEGGRTALSGLRAPAGWIWQADSTELDTLHEMPVDDLVEHETSIDCICGPISFEDGEVTIIAHPSLDNREERSG